MAERIPVPCPHRRFATSGAVVELRERSSPPCSHAPRLLPRHMRQPIPSPQVWLPCRVNPSWPVRFCSVSPDRRTSHMQEPVGAIQECAHLQIRFRQGDVQDPRAESNMQSAFPARIYRCVHRSAHSQTAREEHSHVCRNFLCPSPHPCQRF